MLHDVENVKWKKWNLWDLAVVPDTQNSHTGFPFNKNLEPIYKYIMLLVATVGETHRQALAVSYCV